MLLGGFFYLGIACSIVVWEEVLYALHCSTSLGDFSSALLSVAGIHLMRDMAHHAVSLLLFFLSFPFHRRACMYADLIRWASVGV